MAFADELRGYIAAGFPAIWINTAEHYDAIHDIFEICVAGSWNCIVWDIDLGFGGSAFVAELFDKNEAATLKRPVNMLRSCVRIAQRAGALSRNKTVFVLKNFHRPDIVGNSEVLQALRNACDEGKSQETGWCFVVLAPTSKPPLEWESEFAHVEYPLPSADQLYEIARGLALPEELPSTPEEKAEAMAAAAGLTRRGAENAFSLSILRHRCLQPELLWQLKATALKNCGYLTLYQGDASFDKLGGLEAYKQFSLCLLQSDHELAKPRGQLLLGVSGSGKSQAIKSLGAASGRHVLTLDMGAVRSKYQGETDANVREAIRIAEAMQPCILMIDEVEKALAGATGSGELDSGVSSRVMGTLLTWLNDHESDVFVACTCNDMSSLPVEFARSERFDSVFFFDLPTQAERELIWDIYLKMYELCTEEERRRWIQEYARVSDDWTGAEIKTACRLSAMLHLPPMQAMSYVIPISRRSRQQIIDLRNWASDNCLSASYPGIFRSDRLPPAVTATEPTGPYDKLNRRRHLHADN